MPALSVGERVAWVESPAPLQGLGCATFCLAVALLLFGWEPANDISASQFLAVNGVFQCLMRCRGTS